MSFFNNNKLFLDLDTRSVRDSNKILSFNNITLDKNVADDLNLHTIRITFVKNKIFGQSENKYFEENMETPSYDILSSNINSNLSSHLKNENSDYEINKIIKYSEVPVDALFYDHLYDNSGFLEEDGDENIDDINISKGTYTLTFKSELLTKELALYYFNNREEEFKFFLTAYDENKNLIDSSEIIGLNGRNFYDQVRLEYNDIIGFFKTEVLAPSVDIKITNEGFLIKNYLDHDREGNKDRFDTNFPPPGDPYASSGASNNFRKLVKYPNLNTAYANFVLNNDTLVGPFGGVIDINNGFKSPWIFENSDFEVFESNGVKFGDDGFLDARELNRFNIRRDRNAKIKVKYVSDNLNDIDGDLVIDIENNGTWENTCSFFEDNSSKLSDKLLRDYKNKDEFKFLVQIPYKIQSYIPDWDTDFSLVEEFTLVKNNEFDTLINDLLQRKLIEELSEYFNFSISLETRDFTLENRPVSPIDGEILKLNISRTENQIKDSAFFSTDVSRNPILVDINQVLSETNTKTTLNINKQIFEDKNLSDNFVNLGTNSFLENLSGKTFFFELLHRQKSSIEISGEIILVISGFYDGKEVKVFYPIDIPNGIYLNEGSYINDILPSSGLYSIDFTNGTTDNMSFFDFSIKFDKAKSDILSRTLLFGNTANQADQNDTDSPSFLEKMLLDIDHVKHIYRIRTQDNSFRNPIIITKSPLQLKNFKLGLPKYIETNSHYIIENFLTDAARDLRINPTDLISLNRTAKLIISSFMSNSLEELSSIKSLTSIDYRIQVKFRSFIFPKDLNIEYEQQGEGDLSNINYTNLNSPEFNSNITNKQKYRIFNYVYEKNPEANNHKEITVKWLSRNFKNDFGSSNSMYHQNSSAVKNYFMGNQYLVANSTNNTFTQELTSIANNVNVLNGNYDYDLLVEDNVSNLVSINVDSNVKNIISRETPSDHDPIFGKLGNITMNLIPYGASDKSKTAFYLTSNNSLDWDSSEISNVEVVFIPQIINNNIKTTIKNLSSSAQIENISLRNTLYIGHNRGQEGNINFKPKFAKNCEYSVKDNNKTLEIKIDTNPTTGNFFALSTLTNRCTSDSSGFVQSGGIFTTDVLRNLPNVKNKAKIFKSSLMEKTCIVRNFVYRIKITFTNNRVLYKNYIVPTKLPQSNLRNTINMDEFRVETLRYLWYTQNSGNPSASESELIRLGQSNEMIYNLTNMPYTTISVGGISHKVYNSVKLLNVPGYILR